MSKMGVFKKIAKRLDETADKRIADVVERAVGKPAPEPAPKPKPTKADLSVPTSGGGGCLRVLEAAGFGGVVVATLAAAIVGRARR